MSEFDDFLKEVEAGVSVGTVIQSAPLLLPPTKNLGEKTPPVDISKPGSDFDSFTEDVYSGRDIAPPGAEDDPEDSDRAARILKAAHVTGFGVDLIATDLEAFEAHIERGKFDADKFKRENPGLASWMADHPTNAAAVRDDLKSLSRIESAIRGFDIGKATTSLGFIKIKELHRGAGRSISGLIGSPASEPIEARLNRVAADLEKTMASEPKGGFFDAPFNSIMKETGYVLGQMFESYGPALLAGMSGFLGGAAGGLWLGAITGPGALVTGLSLGAIGGVAAFRAQLASNAFAVEGGLFYADTGRMRGANGERVDEGTRQVLSYAVGMVNASIEFFTFGIKFKPFRDATRKLFFDGAKKYLVNNSAKQISKTFAKSYAKILGAEMVEEFSQELTQILGEKILKMASEGEFESTSPEEVFERLLTIMGKTAQGMSLIGAIGPGVNLSVDVSRSRRAAKNADMFKAIGEGVQGSKTFDRLPVKLREIVKRITADGPVESLYTPSSTWVEYFQSKGIDPREMAIEVLGTEGGEAFDQAVATGGDLVIPTEVYAATLAGSGHNDFFVNELRTDPDEMNAREGREFADTMNAHEAAIRDEAATLDEPAIKVRDAILQQLLATGQNRDTAEAYADILSAPFRAWASRTGQSAEDLFRRFGASIVRAMPDILTKERAPDIDKMDTLLDRLRRGDEPTDADIFGKSLVEFLREKGLRDDQGALAALEPDTGLKPFQRRLVREEGQTLDDATLSAFEAGFFPGFDERPEINDLLEAIDSEIRGGEQIFSGDDENLGLLQLRESLDELDYILTEADINLDNLSNQEVKDIFKRLMAPRTDADTTLGQGPVGSGVVGPGGVIKPQNKPPTAEEIKNAKADTRKDAKSVSERLRIIVPEALRVNGGEYTVMDIEALSDEEINATEEYETLTVKENLKLFREAVKDSSRAAKDAVKATGAKPAATQEDIEGWFSLPRRAQFWYELSSGTFKNKTPFSPLTDLELFLIFADVMGATSAQATPRDNLQRAIAVMSQYLSQSPITVDLFQPAEVADALRRGGRITSNLAGNKTGMFSNTFILVAGVLVEFPISVNDVWVGKMYGLTERQLLENQSLHEVIALHQIKMRDLINERNPGKKFQHETWGIQARQWVWQRINEGQSETNNDFAQEWAGLIKNLKDAGIKTDGDTITMDNLLDSRFPVAARPSIERFEASPMATPEVATERTPEGKKAKRLLGIAKGLDEGLYTKMRADYVKLMLQTLSRSARDKVTVWEDLVGAILAPQFEREDGEFKLLKGFKLTRLEMGTQGKPFSVGGSFEGGVNPNLRIPMSVRHRGETRFLTIGEIQYFNAIVGQALRQAAMAASHFIYNVDPNNIPDGYIANRVGRINTDRQLTEAELLAFQEALPGGHTFNFKKDPGGWLLEINPDFVGDDVVAISKEGLERALGDAFGEMFPTDDVVIIEAASDATDYQEVDAKAGGPVPNYAIIQAREEELVNDGFRKEFEKLGYAPAVARDIVLDRQDPRETVLLGRTSEDSNEGRGRRLAEAIWEYRNDISLKKARVESLASFLSAGLQELFDDKQTTSKKTGKISTRRGWISKLRNAGASDTDLTTLHQKAFQGTPAEPFQYYDSAFNRTGEGTNYRGAGHYFASLLDVGEYYRKRLAGKISNFLDGKEVRPQGLGNVLPRHTVKSSLEKKAPEEPKRFEELGKEEQERRVFSFMLFEAERDILEEDGGALTERARFAAGMEIDGNLTTRLEELGRIQEFESGGRSDLAIGSPTFQEARRIDRQNIIDKKTVVSDTVIKGSIQRAITIAKDSLSDRIDELNAFKKAIKEADLNRIEQKEPGHIVTVEIPESDQFLHLEESLANQPAPVKEAIAKIPDEVWAGVESAYLGFFDAEGTLHREDRDVSGWELYRALETYASESTLMPENDDGSMSFARETSNYLLSLGIQGNVFPDKFTRLGKVEPGKESDIFVVFDDRAIEIKEFDQPKVKGEKVMRGLIRFDAAQRGAPRREFTIELLKDANLSTLLHEGGHWFLEIMGDLAQDGKNPSIAQDYATVLKWFGVSSREEITDAHHEQLADGLLVYLMEGKSPSAALRKVFSRIRIWLLSLFRTASALDVEINDDVRAVFDRMMATDDEISAAQKMLPPPMFDSAQSAGMTEKQFEKYQADHTEAVETAEEELRVTVLAELTREQKKWWREARAKVRGEVESEVFEQTDQIASSVLRRGKLANGEDIPEGIESFKISKQAIVDEFGKDALKGLKGYYSVSGGIHQDQAAEILGYKSGRDLINGLLNIRNAEQLIDAETDVRMRATHGDIMTDGTLPERAVVAVHNEKRALLLRKELEFLAAKKLPTLKGVIKRMARRIPLVEAIRQKANDIIAGKRVRDIKPSLYQRAGIKAGQSAVNAALAGDFELAFDEKQKELLNHELYRAAVNAQEEVDNTLAYTSRLSKRASRERIGKAGGSYLEQIDKILDRFDFRKNPKPNVDAKSFASWVIEQKELGHTVDIPDRVLNEAHRQHFRDTSVGDLLDIRDTLKQIEHLARVKNKLLKNKRTADLQTAVNEIVTEISTHHDTAAEAVDHAPGFAKRIRTGLKQKLAAHTKLEFLFGWLDGNKEHGPTHQHLFEPIAQAEDFENEMMERMVKGMNDIFSVYSKMERATWFYKKKNIDEIGSSMTKANILSVALNWGNAYNRNSLMEGYGWSEVQVDAILSNMDERDWQTVQAVWDLIDTLWPQVEAQEKVMKGVSPAKVQAMEVVTPFGTFRGGYYPLIFDSKLSWKQAQLDEKAAVTDIFGGSWASAATRKGHTIERQGSGGKPPLLDLTALVEHISDVVHDLAFRQPILDVMRISEHDDVRIAIENTAGREMYRLIKPWLANIASERRGEHFNPMEQLFGTLRKGATVVNMGWKSTTAIVQFMGYTVSIKEMGPVYAAKGLASFYGKPWKMAEKWAFIVERSRFMKDRPTNYDRDVRDTMKRLSITGGSPGPLSIASAYSQDLTRSWFYLIAMMDMAVSAPTWLGSYAKAMDGKIENIEAGNEVDAISHANRTVRVTQGSGNAKDLASVQRGQEAWKLFTMFFSYFSVLGNQFGKTVGEVNMDRNIPKFVANLFLIWFLPAALEDLIVGRGPDDDEEIPDYLARKILNYPFQTIVLVRDVASSFDWYMKTGRKSSQGSPGLDALDAILVEPLVALHKISTSGEVTRKEVKAFTMSSSYLLHLPGRQAWLTSEYFHDWITGEEEPENAFEGMWRGLVTGKPRK